MLQPEKEIKKDKLKGHYIGIVHNSACGGSVRARVNCT